jgi:crotonobetainyl-CoA:carnitine CoA-transferase CaiB-like acyl-CoA transferase
MGPSCGLVLSELGAEVIKVEPAPEGDRTRVLKGHIAGAFVYFNRSKKSIGLNLKSEGGREVAHKLLKSADVLIENFAPGTADKLGVGWDEISKLNPRLIYCSLKGYLPGPYEKWAALDEMVQFSTGLSYMTGPPGQPLRAGSSVIDIMGGTFGAVGILAALHKRDKTGKGELITSALYESSAYLVGQHMAGEVQTGNPSLPMPIRPRSWGIYDVFKTKDGKEIFMGVTSDKQWISFCDLYDRQDLFTQERFDTNEKRRENHDDLYDILQEIFIAYDYQALQTMLVDVGIPASPVAVPGDLFEDPQMNADNRMSETEFADGKVAKLPRLPITLGDGKARMDGQAPEFAADTSAVLTELGLSTEDIDELRKLGHIT